MSTETFLVISNFNDALEKQLMKNKEYNLLFIRTFILCTYERILEDIIDSLPPDNRQQIIDNFQKRIDFMNKEK